MKMTISLNTDTRYLVFNSTNGRYYGNSVWTYDRDRAVHFPTQEDALKVSKAYTNTKVITA